MRRLLVAWSWVALTTSAFANGRPPGTSTITFRPGQESTIAAGTSFGLLISNDGGVTWNWMCEDALPYGGAYDPDYTLLSSGTLFATTFEGLKANRDGCVFDSVLAPPPPGQKFFSTTTRGPDQALYVAASDPSDGKVYKSTDDGMTFPTSSLPGQLADWWQSLEVAPSDASRLYLAGFRFVQTPTGAAKVLLLYTSTDGGTSWTPLPVYDFTSMSNSTLDIVGVSKTDANTVYARVSLADNVASGAIYKSTDGGASWVPILGKPSSIAFLVRANGDLVAGTQTQGAFVSTNGGETWTALVGAPHINCLVENTAGEVWACTQNYGSPQVPTDGFGIMKSTDLSTWTGVLRYQDINQPVACPASTPQYTKCDRNPNPAAGWCGLCAQLGCDPKRPCSNDLPDDPPDAQPVDAGSSGGSHTGTGGGCCDTRAGRAPSALALATALGVLLLRRRRRG